MLATAADAVQYFADIGPCYRMMELRHLRYFVAVAEERNFTRAALRLRIAQPPLSQQIQRLEDDLGFRLFDRTARRVALTPAGEQFLKHARRVLDAAGEAIRAARGLASPGPSMTLGFVSSAAYTLLPLVGRALRAHRRDVAMVFRELTVDEQLEALADGKIDVGLLRPPVADPSLCVHLVVDEPFVIAVGEDLLPSGRGALSVGALADVPLVMFSTGLTPGFAELLTEYCRRHGVAPTIAAETAQIHTLLAFVGAGIGAGFVPSSASRLNVPGVRFRKLVEPTPRACYALAWRPDRAPPGIEAMTRRRFSLT